MLTTSKRRRLSTAPPNPASASDGPGDEVVEQIQELEAKVQRLMERADFTERLVGDGRSERSDTEIKAEAS